MAFKMKGFPTHEGVSPMSKLDDPSFGAEEGNYPTKTESTTTPKEVVKDEDKNKKVPGTNAGSLEGVVPKNSTTTTPPEGTQGADLDASKEDTENEKLMAQSKKEMYANAWQNSGIGHMVEAGKSIGRGIKKYKAKRAAKKTAKENKELASKKERENFKPGEFSTKQRLKGNLVVNQELMNKKIRKPKVKKKNNKTEKENIHLESRRRSKEINAKNR